MKPVKKTLPYLHVQLAYVALLLLILLNGICFGQTVNTNQGTDFWFGYIDTEDGTTVTEAIYITSFKNASGTVAIPNIPLSIPFTVTPGAVTRLTVPSADVVLHSITGTGNAVHITSTANISVHAAIEYDLRSDNACILPTPTLGNQYYLMAFTQISGNPILPSSWPSEFMVVAQDCKDSVEIIPSQNLKSGAPAGVPFTVVLQPGQVYQAQSAQGTLQSNVDLTGSVILSLNHSETAVIGGSAFNPISDPLHNCTSTTGNPLYEEMYPINTWGKNYIFLSTPNSEDQCRILSEQNGTTVTFYTGSYTSVQTLNAGQYFDTTIAFATPVFISASNPVSVGRFLESNSCNQNIYGLGDPSEVMVDANEQMFLDSITFYTNTNPDLDSSYIEVITRTADINTVFLDGTNLRTYFVPLAVGPTSNAYSYASLAVLTMGSHTLTTTGGGFLAYSTGLSVAGNLDALACDAGIYLKNISITDVTPLTDTITLYTATTCAGNDGTATAVVSGIPGFSYLWSNGETTATATGLSAGAYKVIVSDSDCVLHKDSAIVVIPQGGGSGGAISISTNPSGAICAGIPVTISISGGTGYQWNNSSSSTTSSITVTPTVDTTYSVVISGACSPVDTSITITVHPAPVVTITPDTSICAGNNIILNVTGGGTYSWSDGGTNTSTSSSFSVTPSSTVTYSVEVTKNGCMKDTATTITVNTPPVITLKGTIAICVGQSIALNASGANKYSWVPDTGLSCINCASPIASPIATITYTVTAGITGCTTTKTITVSVNPYPVANFYPTPDTVTDGGIINFVNLSTGASSYYWNLGDGTTSADTALSHQYNQPGVHLVALVGINSFGCSDSITEDVYVNEPIKVPNIFTPNGDKINDEFVVTADGMQTYDIQIYDRWGKKLFESNSPGVSWTGKNASGEMESDGTYYYIIKASDYTGKTFNFNGYLQLIKE